MHTNITIIGVPVDLGAGRRGVDMGPSAIRYAGLAERLRAIGCSVLDLGDLGVPLADIIPQPAPTEKLRYLGPIADLNRNLCEKVARVVENNSFPLILGGDHSLAIGSIRGSSRDRRIGVIWIDAHGDFNTAQTTPSGNIHGMSLAAITGRGHPELVGPSQAVTDADCAIIGVRDLDPAEQVALRGSGIHAFSMHEIDRRGMASIVEEAIQIVSANTVGFHLSLDLDALDPAEAPGVGTPVPGGLTYRETHLAMEMIAESQRMLSMDLVEVNPILDTHNRTAEHAVAFALSALGKRILAKKSTK
jgi:arginase